MGSSEVMVGSRGDGQGFWVVGACAQSSKMFRSIATHLPFLFCKRMPSSWQKVVHTPLCIMIRLPFESRYFNRSIGVRGRWNTPQCCCSEVEDEDSHGIQAIMLAAMRGEADICRLLIEKRADPNSSNVDGETPLMMASVTSSVPVVTKLIRRMSGTPTITECQERKIHPENPPKTKKLT